MSRRIRFILIGVASVVVLAAVVFAFLLPSPLLGGGGANPHPKRDAGSTIVFLYAVTTDGTIETYSPVKGQIKVFGQVTQSGTHADKTIGGKPASCIKMTGAGGDVSKPETLPFLYWIDVQGLEQQQFFSDQQVVYVCDEPLAEDADTNTLQSVPQS